MYPHSAILYFVMYRPEIVFFMDWIGLVCAGSHVGFGCTTQIDWSSDYQHRVNTYSSYTSSYVLAEMEYPVNFRREAYCDLFISPCENSVPVDQNIHECINHS